MMVVMIESEEEEMGIIYITYREFSDDLICLKIYMFNMFKDI